MTSLIAQGAEAILTKKEDVLVKERVVKGYRDPGLDRSLRRFRTKREVKVLKKLAEHNIKVPHVLAVEESSFSMEWIEGDLLRDYLDTHPAVDLFQEIGSIMGKIHDLDIVHGDLTTSNMILKDNKIVLIDFGLAQFSSKVEDKAVDLHLFKQALESRHSQVWEKAFTQFLSGYQPANKKEELSRLEKVEKRGRNKQKGS